MAILLLSSKWKYHYGNPSLMMTEKRSFSSSDLRSHVVDAIYQTKVNHGTLLRQNECTSEFHRSCTCLSNKTPIIRENSPIMHVKYNGD
jgi:hypothetical protein